MIAHDTSMMVKGEGRVKVKLIVEGPIGLLMTTTDQALHPEDENRVIAYRLMGSPERIKEALKRQARDSSLVTGKRALDTKPWFELHQMVAQSSKAVSIPFASELADKIDVNQDRAMRDFPKLLSLIKAHALLHQETRKRNSTGIVATLSDYEAVRNLIEPTMTEACVKEFPPKVRDVVTSVQTLANGKGVSVTEVAKHLGEAKPGAIGKYVKIAQAFGFIKNKAERQRKGIKAELVIGDVPLPEKDVFKPAKALPEASELGR